MITVNTAMKRIGIVTLFICPDSVMSLSLKYIPPKVPPQIRSIKIRRPFSTPSRNMIGMLTDRKIRARQTITNRLMIDS